MATSRASDVIPLRRSTKARLTGLKGSRTYDQALSALLDLGEASLAARLDLVDREAVNRAAALVAPQRGREPSKQLLLARLAKERRERWLAEGRLVPLGERRTRYVAPSTTRTTPVVRRVR